MTNRILPLPGLKHGNRLLVSVIEQRAQNGSDRPWVSVPINDQDLSQGYRDISFWQLNNYANHAAKWLSDNLPESTEPFQCFAYAGPKDLRYAILAVAAAKLQKVIVLPSPLMTADAQLRILNAKDCTIYLRPISMADRVGAILRDAPHIRAITSPDLEGFVQETEAILYNYPKAWEDGVDDPWFVFHTSGTTGNPKPVTLTQRMLAVSDRTASMPDFEPSIFDHFAFRRWHTPLPSSHVMGTVMTLAFTTFLQTTVVIGPSTPPTPESVVNVLRYGKAQGALLPPVLLEGICQTESGLNALRNLECIHYGGAPLAAKVGNQLVSHVPVVCTIGASECGAYPTALHDHKDAWDYVKFQENAGVALEYRFNDLYELVFVRKPNCPLQPCFMVYPDRDRFETKDLWVQHPVYKGLWKIIGRTDDYVAFSHAEGLHASSLEPEIEGHPAVKSALIGGHSRPAPVLLIELFPGAIAEGGYEEFLSSLQPHLDKANERCHDCVKLSKDRIILATREKPFIRTIKGSVARLQTLDLYKDEIAALFD